jgi:ABC-type lipoprotein export system ATPase subunit
MSEMLLSARGLHKTYTLGQRLLEVLRGVDLELQRGDFISLRGASGAGNSTLLHLLGGLDTPNEGEVWLAGRNLARLSRRDLARVRNEEVGFIFQAYYLLPELDALENVCLPARMARKPAESVAARGKELLARVGLADRLEHRPYELSGGEQQRVAIARALINEPHLILADEPTGNLDSHTGHEIIDLLCSIREDKQTTLIMATHDAEVAARAPLTITLVDGRRADAPSGTGLQTTVPPHTTP